MYIYLPLLPSSVPCAFNLLDLLQTSERLKSLFTTIYPATLGLLLSLNNLVKMSSLAGPGSNLTLPPDILYIIAQKLVDDVEYDGTRGDSVATLCALCLTSSLFAGMHNINRCIFKSILVTFSDETANRVAETDFTRMRPFVKEVSFSAVLFPLDWNDPDVQKVALAGLKVLRAKIKEELDAYGDEDVADDLLHYCCLGKSTDWEHQAQVEDLDESLGFEDREPSARQAAVTFGRAFQAFTTRNQSKFLAWRTVLMSCSAINTCRVAVPEVSAASKTDNLLHISDSQCRSDCLQYRTLHRVLNKFRSHVFEILVDYLVYARVRLQHLHFGDGFRSSRGFDGSVLLPENWTQLNLSRLETCSCDSFNGFFGYVRSGETGMGLDALETACQSVLEKSQQTVQEFRLVGTLRIGWLDVQSMSFPRLRNLFISNIWIEHTISAEILGCPVLEEISLLRCTVCRPLRDWRMIFDAIRTHPNEPRFHFQFNNGKSWEWPFKISYDPAAQSESESNAVSVVARPRADDPLMDEEEKSLLQYLAQKGPWDENLQRVFP